MAKSIKLQPLNVIERGELRKAESTIEKGQQTFLEVGNALMAIRDGRLYRESHKTFEAYCKERWTFEKAYAYRLIASVQVVNSLSPMGDISTERQARELGNVPEEKRQEVFEAAVEASGGKPTAHHIAEAAKKVTPPKPTEKAPKAEPVKEPSKPESVKEPTIEDRMKAANSVLEGLSRKMLALVGEAEEIDNPHLTDERHGRLETFKAQVRSATATLRSAKGAGVCPYCDGKWCKHCLKTGWVTKATLESAPEKAA
jgi:hypothetical protein